MDATDGDFVLHVNSDTRSRSQRGYDRLAAMYQSIERIAFGSQLQRARVALVDELPAWDRLLIFGDGDGRLLERLCQLPRASGGELRPNETHSHPSPRWRITSVDHSAAMLGRQRARVEAIGAIDRVEFVQGDARGFVPEANAYDVVVVPFFLDCFGRGELEENLPCWLSGLCVGGVLYHVDFQIPESRWQRPRAKFLLWAMHRFFRWQTGLQNRELVPVDDMLRQCGLKKVSECVGGKGMIGSELWRRESASPSVRVTP